MRIKRQYAAAALIGALALGTVACTTNNEGGGTSTGGASGASGEEVEITVLVRESEANTAEFWDAAIAEVTAQVPGVKVTKIVGPDDAYAMQLKSSGQLPDVLGQISAPDFIDDLMPYDSAWLEETFMQPYATALSDGNVYVPPSNSQIIPLVFYNKQIFADNGITAPQTWSEFMDVVKKLRGAGITPLEIAGAEPWAADMPLVGAVSVDVLGQDPDWIQKRINDEVSFADAGFQAAIQKMIDLVQAEAYDPAALSTDYGTANANFLEGKSAMYPMGSWFIGKGYLTDEQAANIGIFPWPSDSGEVVLPFTAGSTFSVNKNSANADKAMEWAKTFVTTTGPFKTLIENDGAFPMFKNKTLEDFGVSVTPLYDEGFAMANSTTAKMVSPIAWAANKDRTLDTWTAAFQAVSQSVFSNSDAAALCADLDAQWATAYAG